MVLFALAVLYSLFTYVAGESIYRNTHVRWRLIPKPPKMLKKIMSDILICILLSLAM